MSLIESVLKNELGQISGGKVLDVGTKEGGFIQTLKEYLNGYTEIIGVDIEEPTSPTSIEIFSPENIQFSKMDAHNLQFDDETFNTVNISATLHHLKNIPQALEEMVRVLKPGGFIIITEMHREAITEAQRSVIAFHHWAANIDNLAGIPHFKTLSRQEIIEYVEKLDLEKFQTFDYQDPAAPTIDEEYIQIIDGYIEKSLERAKKISAYQEQKSIVEDIRQRLLETGRQQEPVLVVIGRK